MLSNFIIKKNKHRLLLYYLKNKFNKKYKKLVRHNMYSRLLDPRNENNTLTKVFLNKNKFYID